MPKKYRDNSGLMQIRDIVSSIRAGTSVNCEERPPRDSEIGVLKTSAVTAGGFASNQCKAVTDKNEIRRVACPVKSGTVLVCRKNTPELVGSSVLVERAPEKVYLPDLLWQIEVQDGFPPRWFGEVLRLPEIRHRMRALSSGTSQSMVNLSQEDFLWLRVPVARESERDLLANLSLKMEKRERNTRGHIDALILRRRALMQQFMTGRRRFPECVKPWKKAELSDICAEETLRNGGKFGRTSVRAVNKFEGMIPMKDHVISDNLTRYKIVKPGWYAYNPMRINIGSICQWDGSDDALVSPDYVVFRCLPGKVDQGFFNAFRRSHRWDAFMARAGAGGVRIRIYFEDLGSLTLPLPDLDEQRKLGKLFDAINREIALLERLHAAYQLQKRGLMQQLLTGKRRVKVAAAGEAP